MNYKLLLSAFFFTIACFSLHAATPCYCGVSALVDMMLFDSQSSIIYIAENTPIYNSNLLLAKQAFPVNNHKKVTEVKKEVPIPAVDENKAAECQPASVVLPAFPFAPSSSFLFYSRESATIPPQKRNDGQNWILNACLVITYKHITNPILSPYFHEQRQKLSTAATQCGMLTSFGSNTPPLKSLSLRPELDSGSTRNPLK